MLCCPSSTMRAICDDVSDVSLRKNLGGCGRGHAIFLMLWMMSMRSDRKAGVDLWSSCVQAMDVCCRAKAGGAVVAMTCIGAIDLITWVWPAAVATGVDQESFCIHVVLSICLGRVSVMPQVGLGSCWVGFPTMCSPACGCLCWCCDGAGYVGSASLVACVLTIGPSVSKLSDQLRKQTLISLALGWAAVGCCQ
jgi:hypothetical protein